MKNGGMMVQVFFKKDVNKESWLMTPRFWKGDAKISEGLQDMFESLLVTILDDDPLHSFSYCIWDLSKTLIVFDLSYLYQQTPAQDGQSWFKHI